MTESAPDLRDARLHKALAHAPDAQDLPEEVTRNAILKIANNSIPTRANGTIYSKMPWWRSWWAQTGARGGPWNAAFATVLLGSIITLIWFEREVPGARPDEVPAAAQKLPAPPPIAVQETLNNNGAVAVQPDGPGAVPPAPAPAAPPVRVTPKPGPDAPAAPATPSPKTVEPMPLPLARQSGIAPVPAPAMRSESPLADRQPELGPGNTSRDKTVGEIASLQKKAESSAAPAPIPAPSPAPSSDLARAPTARLAAAPAAAPAPLAAGAAATTPRVAGLADQAKSGSGPRAINAPADWTQAEVAYLGRVVRFARADAQSLVDRLLALMAANPPGQVDVADGPPLLRVQLLDVNGTQAQFEFWSDAYRAKRMGRPDDVGPLLAKDLQDLLAEARRAVPP